MGAILSAALMLEHSLGLPQAAREVRQAVDRALEAGILTPDLGGTSTTEEMTAAVLRALPAPATLGAGS
jgi:3-isopropylmalate dehydrogenase